VPMDKNCKLLESKRSGSRFTFSFRCQSAGSDYTGTGEMSYQGRDAYVGKMTAKGTMEGEAVDMTNQWSGKRVGHCTYEDPSKQASRVMAQANAEVAKACNQAVDELATMLVVGDTALCKDRKADFCARVTQVAGELRDPAGFDRHAQKDWRGAMQACGQDPAPILSQACGVALAKRDGGFLRKHCPGEAVAARRQFCVGRSYTSVDPSARDLCGELGGLSYTADAPSAAAPAAAPDAKGTLTDKLKDGASKLKKFLKF